ncbi:MAG: VacJ family lipoprotein [bacterium]|nr:VacJ family lipoprotein [bacterium]
MLKQFVMFVLATAILTVGAPTLGAQSATPPVAPVANPMFAAAETLDPVSPAEEVPFPAVINDPIEPFNRSIYAFNDVFIQGIANPAAKGWRAITNLPVRKSVRKAGLNLGWPKRLFGNLLQARWKGAAVETGRFMINTTVGLLGFFDPASRMGMNPYEEDWGQAFGAWGSGPGFFLTLPILGPDSGRDTLALPFNLATDGTTYAGGVLFSLNKFSFVLPAYEQMRVVEKDPYFWVRELWALERQADVMDFELQTAEDIHPSQTLGVLFLNVKDPEFPDRAAEYEAKVPTTGRKMPYSLWIQDKPAPLVFLLPGVASHRMSESTMALAEMIYQRGMSVVTISSAMNWEFMETAGSVAVPGYAPIDAWDAYVALNAVYNDLIERYRERFTKTALVGFSLGGLHTLFISSFEVTGRQRDLHFDHYIAVNPPVDLIYALKQIDAYYNAPMEWNPAVRTQRTMDTLMKAVRISQSESVPSNDLTPSAALPFSEIESRYLIGLNYRLILRDIIYSSQRRLNMGVLQHKPRSMRRDPVYNEIMKFSYIRYVNDFVIPYYLKYTNQPVNREEMLTKTNLWSIGADLTANPKLRVSINENDFLLRAIDIDWLGKVLGPRLLRFKEGGHLGNLYLPRVQDEIFKSLDPLLKP